MTSLSFQALSNRLMFKLSRSSKLWVYLSATSQGMIASRDCNRVKMFWMKMQRSTHDPGDEREIFKLVATPRCFVWENATMKLETSMLIAGLLLALLVHGNFVYLIMLDFYSGRVIYVNKKHMNITVEGCATPRLTLGCLSPWNAPFGKGAGSRCRWVERNCRDSPVATWCQRQGSMDPIKIVLMWLFFNSWICV